MRILAHILLACACQSFAEATVLKVLTWNVGRIYLGEDVESRLDERQLDHVAAVIREAGPEVACLQEVVDRAQAGRLAERLGGEYRFALYEDNYDRRAAMFVRGEARWTSLTVEGGPQFPAASFQDGAVSALCVHLSSFDQDRRRKQVGQVLEWAGRAPGTVLVAGDFNLLPQSLDYTRLAALLRDATESIRSSTLYGLKFDYVFYRGPDPWTAAATRLDGARKPPMDHDPIVAELSPAK